MSNIIITAGEKYNDIDALACAIAYKNLLELQGKQSDVVFTGPLNESVSKSVRNFGFTYKTQITEDPFNYNYVLVDISDPTKISKFVPLEKVIEVYDHRWGFEKYWNDKTWVRTQIDTVGACATLIWEKFKEYELQDKIDSVSANLLLTAIISNTLNLKAQITSDRDREAVKELGHCVDLKDNWVETYFDEITSSVLQDPTSAIKNDTKIESINNVEFCIMQIELWDSREFVEKHITLIQDLLHKSNCDNSFLTSPSISEAKNYIITLSDEIKELLTTRINAKFEGNIGTTDKLWLRKEIIREIASSKK